MTELEMDRHAGRVLLMACSAVADNDAQREVFACASATLGGDLAPWQSAKRCFADGSHHFTQFEIEAIINGALDLAIDGSPEGDHADRLIERLGEEVLSRREFGIDE